MGTKCFLGVDLGGTSTKLGVCNAGGTVLHADHFLTQSELGPERWVQQVFSLVNSWNLPFESIGVGSPGPMDTKTGTILVTPNLKSFEGYPMKSNLERLFKKPVYFENDANCGALAEYHFGEQKGCSDLVVLTLGTGLGSGVISNHRLIRGSGGLAVELGHVVMDWHRFVESPEPGVRPIMRGTMEESVGSRLTLKRWNEFSPGVPMDGLKSVFELAQTGNAQAQKFVDQWTSALSVVVYNAIVIFNPLVVVIAGGVSGAWAEVQPNLMNRLRSWVLEPFLANLTVAPSRLQTNFGVMGAAALAISESE